MICNAEYIAQPYSGEYVEKVYNIESSWNTGSWAWIKFSDENGEWCGEFRGEYKSVSVSKKLGIVVVLTTDYMYVLDINTAEVIEYRSQPEYIETIVSPYDDIFITDGYGLEMFVTNKVKDLQTIVIPAYPDNLRFVEWEGNILKMECYEFLNWEKKIELYLDCVSFEWTVRE